MSIPTKNSGTNSLFKEESIKLIFSIVATTIGFFLALFFNSLVEDQKEKETYEVMKKMVHRQATNNSVILSTTIQRSGVDSVFLDFETDLSEKFISDKTFLKYAGDSLANQIVWANDNFKLIKKTLDAAGHKKLDSLTVEKVLHTALQASKYNNNVIRQTND